MSHKEKQDLSGETSFSYDNADCWKEFPTRWNWTEIESKENTVEPPRRQEREGTQRGGI